MADEDDGGWASDETESEYQQRYYGATDRHTVKFQTKVRAEMQTDVEKFLSSGGRIEKLPKYATGEPDRLGAFIPANS